MIQHAYESAPRAMAVAPFQNQCYQEEINQSLIIKLEPSPPSFSLYHHGPIPGPLPQARVVGQAEGVFAGGRILPVNF